MTEISVAVNSAGLAPGTYKGKLAVVKVGARDMREEEAPTGVEVPVAFAVIPANPDVATARQSTRVGIESRPRHGETYGAGEDIAIRAEFGTPVEVQGNPTLALTVGNQVRRAVWNGGTTNLCGGYSALAFRYVVQSADTDSDGVAIAANSLALNGGTIQTAAGSAAILDLGGSAIGTNASHKVDGSVATTPAVSRARITSRPLNGSAYGEGEDIVLFVRFTGLIEAAGNPRLALQVGSRNRHARFSGISVSGYALFFRYRVVREDVDADGISVASNALGLNGGPSAAWPAPPRFSISEPMPSPATPSIRSMGAWRPLRR